MAKIKKGTYRFNDILSPIPYEEFTEIPLKFTVANSVIVDEELMRVYLSPEPYNATLFVFGGSLISNEKSIGYGTSHNENNGVYVDSEPYYWNFTWVFYSILASEHGVTVDDDVKGYGQTITVIEDTEVDDIFGTWFTKNTTPAYNLRPLFIKNSESLGNGYAMQVLSMEFMQIEKDGVQFLVRIGETAEVIGRSKNSTITDIVIPSEIEGVPVTRIDGSAFHGTNITSVIIPDSVEQTGTAVFAECHDLTNVVIGNGLYNIYAELFWNCKSLKTVTIGKSVQSIGMGAFSGCDSLTDVYFRGTEEYWNSLYKGSDNDALLNATIHFVDEEKYHIAVRDSISGEYKAFICQLGSTWADFIASDASHGSFSIKTNTLGEPFVAYNNCLLYKQNEPMVYENRIGATSEISIADGQTTAVAFYNSENVIESDVIDTHGYIHDGTHVFNYVVNNISSWLSSDSYDSSDSTFLMDFVSAGMACEGIWIEPGFIYPGEERIYYLLNGDWQLVYINGAWVSDSYRTVALSTATSEKPAKFIYWWLNNTTYNGKWDTGGSIIYSV